MTLPLKLILAALAAAALLSGAASHSAQAAPQARPLLVADTEWRPGKKALERARKNSNTQARERQRRRLGGATGPTPSDPTAGTAFSPKYRPMPFDPQAPRPGERGGLPEKPEE